MRIQLVTAVDLKLQRKLIVYQSLTKMKYTISRIILYSKYTEAIYIKYTLSLLKVYFKLLLKVDFYYTCFHLILEHQKYT